MADDKNEDQKPEQEHPTPPKLPLRSELYFNNGRPQETK